MQILDTKIHAGPEGVLVEFFGEGGEKIAVTMAVAGPQPSLGDAALIARARQMMVQCAAFGFEEDSSRRNREPNIDPEGSQMEGGS